MIAPLKRLIPRSVKRHLSLWWRRNDLPWLADYFGTDKWGLHRYAPHYARHLAHLRRRRFNLLEIGVGGHDNPLAGGNSLRMWKAYFPYAQIFGLDLFDKSALQEDRITIVQGSQADSACLRSLAERIGRLDVVIADGSHVNAHVLTSVRTLFPLLPDGAIYVIEDLHTAYWPAFGGSARPTPETSIGWVKDRIDGLHWEDIDGRPTEPFDQHIVAIHLYHNLVFLSKGVNVEGSTKGQAHLVHDGIHTTPVFTDGRPQSWIL